MTARRHLTPWRLLAGLACLAAVFLLLKPYQPLAAAVFLALAGGLAVLDPKAGLYLTFLACPLFLGETHDPFIPLVELLAGLTVLSWLARLAWERRWPRLPRRGWLLLLAALLAVNLPIDLKELLFSLRFLDLSQSLFLLAEGRKFHDLYPLRCWLLNLGGLLFLACCLDLLRREDLRPLGTALLAEAGALGLVSLLLWWNVLPTTGW
jgi:hypothetical protein